MSRLLWCLAALALLSLAACSSATNSAVSTAVAGTLEAQVVSTGVAATQVAATSVSSTRSAIVTPTPTPRILCIEAAADVLDETEIILERWFDALEIADSTPRVSLAGPVAELQTIRREFADFEFPPCAMRVKRAVDSHMDYAIDGMLDFMRQDPYESAMKQAGNSLDAYYAALDKFTEEAIDATREASITPTPD